MKRALITGITGQDGSYLAESLLKKGYQVHGIIRRVALESDEVHLWRINHIKDKLTLHRASLESLSSLHRVVNEVQPHECYHLAAQSFVADSFEDEFSTMATNINGTHNMLWTIRNCVPETRFYFAASSEMFGKVQETPQTETTAFYPRSPYGISKVTGYELTRNYREAYGMFASNGILFNHESPRRGMEFVTRKISSCAARIKRGMEKHLPLGNLEPLRDWGHAREYVEAMWLMLQQDQPGDFVISTQEHHSVREFVEMAFSYLGLDYRDYVVADPQFIRAAEVYTLLGDSSRATAVLGWKSQTAFADLVKEMVDKDLWILQGRQWTVPMSLATLNSNESFNGVA